MKTRARATSAGKRQASVTAGPFRPEDTSCSPTAAHWPGGFSVRGGANRRFRQRSLSLWDWLTSATVTSTATQTLDDERSLHQWRSIQGLELQKVQHNIQSALRKRRAAGRSSGSQSHSSTEMLEQMQERLHSIAQDMYILNRCYGEEIVRSSVARARKAAPKKRRRTRRRNRVRPAKQACSDTIEESTSSTDEVTPQRKRARVYRGSPPSR